METDTFSEVLISQGLILTDEMVAWKCTILTKIT